MVYIYSRSFLYFIYEGASSTKDNFLTILTILITTKFQSPVLKDYLFVHLETKNAQIFRNLKEDCCKFVGSFAFQSGLTLWANNTLCHFQELTVKTSEQCGDIQQRLIQKAPAYVTYVLCKKPSSTVTTPSTQKSKKPQQQSTFATCNHNFQREIRSATRPLDFFAVVIYGWNNNLIGMDFFQINEVVVDYNQLYILVSLVKFGTSGTSLFKFGASAKRLADPLLGCSLFPVLCIIVKKMVETRMVVVQSSDGRYLIRFQQALHQTDQNQTGVCITLRRKRLDLLLQDNYLVVGYFHNLFVVSSDVRRIYEYEKISGYPAGTQQISW
uniref:Uncharacterized protein n=1 Tax=Romanomermis culicivorax TaxID=13658 RepID=A0A915KWG3_ROMCU